MSDVGTTWPTYTPPPPPAPPVDDAGGRLGWTPLGVAGGALLAGAAILHVVALFPSLGPGLGTQSATASSIVMEAILAAGWLVAALLVLTCRPRAAAAGAALAAGLALAEAGILLSNVASTFSAVSAGPGTWLMIASWAVGAAGAGVAIAGSPLRSLGSPGLPPHRELVPLTALAAIALGFALLPAWDRYVLDLATLGEDKVERLGSAFAAHTPAGVVAGDLIAAVAFAVVPIVAVLWRPGRLGTLFSGGVLVVVAAQLASAVAGFKVTSADYFAPASEVRELGLSVQSSALTIWFDIEVVAFLALLVLVVARWWTPDGTSLLAGSPASPADQGYGAGMPGAYGGGLPGAYGAGMPGAYSSGVPWAYGSTVPASREPAPPQGYWAPPGGAPQGTTANPSAYAPPAPFGAPPPPWGHGSPPDAEPGTEPTWASEPQPPGSADPPA